MYKYTYKYAYAYECTCTCIHSSDKDIKLHCYQTNTSSRMVIYGPINRKTLEKISIVPIEIRKDFPSAIAHAGYTDLCKQFKHAVMLCNFYIP